VREGDHILAVDNTLTASLAQGKVSDLLRGAGSQVSVTYSRPGVAEQIKLKFTRRVSVPAVAYTGVFGDHGYIPLQTFNENTADEVRGAVDQLLEQGARASYSTCATMAAVSSSRR
jgi:C-terminal processing protease CtpA/Prc